MKTKITALAIAIIIALTIGCKDGKIINPFGAVDSTSPSLKVNFFSGLFPYVDNPDEDNIMTFCYNIDDEDCGENGGLNNFAPGESSATVTPCDSDISVFLDVQDEGGVSKVIIFFQNTDERTEEDFAENPDLADNRIVRKIIEEGVLTVQRDEEPEWNEQWNTENFQNITLEYGPAPDDSNEEGYFIELKETDPEERFRSFNYFMHFDCLCYLKGAIEFRIYTYDFAGNEMHTGAIPISWVGDNTGSSPHCDGNEPNSAGGEGYAVFNQAAACEACEEMFGELLTDYKYEDADLDACPCTSNE